jgi:DNA repair protein RadA/Sms
MVNQLSSIPVPQLNRYQTGTGFDSVLGGGLVAGSAILLGGMAGSGKSTLIMQISQQIASQGKKVLIILGEESTEQVKLRSIRLKSISDNIYTTEDKTLPEIIKAIDHVKPAVIIIDSLQTIYDPAKKQAAGRPIQMETCSTVLTAKIKKENTAAIIYIGHTTKSGLLAGAQTIQHMVDVVAMILVSGNIRTIFARKNRYGASFVEWVTTMTPRGLVTASGASPGLGSLGGLLEVLEGIIINIYKLIYNLLKFIYWSFFLLCLIIFRSSPKHHPTPIKTA